MTNFDLCAQVFSFLREANVDTVVVCAGARNAPFVFHLQNENFKTYFFFEERSAAFFALGLMKQKNKPVAVITTSGTAVAELLPATIEACYQGLPLILISADRPKSYRNSGAPQSIQQPGIFTTYAEASYDWDVFEVNYDVRVSLQKPIHFNICFDEPLMDQSSLAISKLNYQLVENPPYRKATAADFSEIKNPFVVVSQIDEASVQKVKDFILKLKAPVYLEALSQLNGDDTIKPFLIQSSDTMVKKIFQEKVCQSVIRIGGVPTIRFWRDLEDKFKETAVYNFTKMPYSGLARFSKNFDLDFDHFNSGTLPTAVISKLKEKDNLLEKSKINLLNEFPSSEPTFFSALSMVVGSDPLYIGNSLPIREWDLFANKDVPKKQNVYANRGANGIDGQISTYLGWSNAKDISWCVVGDLTALYDLASLGLSPQLDQNRKRRIIVINNQGGHIFKRVFNKDQFLNTHAIEFQMWAQMWKWDYLKVTSPEQLSQIRANHSQNLVIEIQPNNQQSTQFWNAWDEACLKI